MTDMVISMAFTILYTLHATDYYSIMNFSFIWPLILVVLSNVFYNILTKITPEKADAFLSLAVSYLTGAAVSFGLYLLTGAKTGSFKEHLAQLNWTSVLLGIVIVGLELGYIFAFRAGWKINTTSIVANITLACILLAVGFFMFRETMTIRQLLGIGVCIAGLVMISK